MTTQTDPLVAPDVADEPARTGLGARLRGLVGAQAMQIVLVWLVIVVLFSVLSPEAFLSLSNFRGIAISVAILGVLGVGTTFIIITGGIDLSMGSVLVFSGVVASLVMGNLGDGEGWGVAVAGILAAVGSGLAWGLVNGFLVAKAKVPPMIVTLGTFGAALGLAQVLTDGIDRRDVAQVLVNSVGFGNVLGRVPIIVLVSAVAVAAGIVVLNHTKFGLHTRAVGSNAEACRRVGIAVDHQLIKVYALAGGLAGVAGLLNLSFFRSTTIAGHSLTNLDVIAGVVIGGTSLFGGFGTVFGTAVGLFIPVTLRNGFVILGVEPYWQRVVVGAFLIAAVYIDQVRRAAAVRGTSHSAVSRTLHRNGKDR